CVAVANELAHLSNPIHSAGCVSSAAVGELRDSPLATARYLAQHFSLLKVGLSGMRERGGWSTALVDFSRQLQSLGANLVPVIYADYELCSAPTPFQVIEVSEQLDGATDRRSDPRQMGRATDRRSDPRQMDGATDRRSDPRLKSAQISEVVEHDNGQFDLVNSSTRYKSITEAAPRYLLVDTFTKDGRGLLDWLEVFQLEAIIQHAAQVGRQIVLAGSLSQRDLPKLRNLSVAAIAVRGAVCANGRRSEVCPQKLQQWVELFRNG
ncbi:MAG: hypothetical protein KDA51_01680, partial [Planctomycetales bacterium]|nr:hypothetical protein [Planctomycetales bacterium]